MRSESLIALACTVLAVTGLAWLLAGNDAARRVVFPAKAAPTKLAPAKAPAACPCGHDCDCAPCDCEQAGAVRPWFPGRVIWHSITFPFRKKAPRNPVFPHLWPKG